MESGSNMVYMTKKRPVLPPGGKWKITKMLNGEKFTSTNIPYKFEDYDFYNYCGPVSTKDPECVHHKFLLSMRGRDSWDFVLCAIVYPMITK